MEQVKIDQLSKNSEPIYRRLHWFSIWYTVVCPECSSPKFKKKRITNMQTYRLYGYCTCGWEWVGNEKSEPWDD